ncbi:hypothetical protein B9Q13_02685 [Candidatus Marsarchaeota G2 archaeon ECH_B_SAG-G16]|jgi:ribosomal protein S18 acetylase RimI-like enzyme|uniref:N-acetyltransferase domain-containing protein n=4 Tax=Candidatus Marsarchaeota TaxID=1978152 RepID=A0A2R6AJ50_9ARCH|nr:MAG: hypothetical protein B9Q01_03715 [Candidatus Marsarchaeota G1 archaeon OSP_D]PSN86386.1 MAG: hypothetical protein B9Q02_02535 [Candidatus Marsarchaeota G1 archaeon BE_D]PSN88534.1 MAG: hypothetical protein B9Q00_05165 [Candidatus Marsarchaeota G1 archaeon OSP_C]PSO05168.1 MAG: hypothetical protein B9Q13_02685 [Candidatus Marsarchaeota G2 archaeon ECH_B_SAG-G16]
MEIAELTEEDLDSYLELFSEDESAKQTMERAGFKLEKEAFKNRLSSFPTWIKVFVLRSDRVEGAVCIAGAENLNLPDSALIVDLRIRKESRKRGYGSMLLETALEYARKKGVKRVVTIVSEMNVAGIKLFHKFGFKPYSILQDYYVLGENAVAMEKVF